MFMCQSGFIYHDYTKEQLPVAKESPEIGAALHVSPCGIRRVR